MLLAAEVLSTFLFSSFETNPVLAQMFTFCLLVAPFPYTVKKKLFRFLSESYIVAKIAYGLKISFM
jgi:Bap31/Bap29 transmembrane region